MDDLMIMLTRLHTYWIELREVVLLTWYIFEIAMQKCRTYKWARKSYLGMNDLRRQLPCQRSLSGDVRKV
jgi:hypothetical protein